jgi:hypothetical protein
MQCPLVLLVKVDWERKLKYCDLRIQSVPQRKHVSVTNISLLTTLFREIIAVCSENYTYKKQLLSVKASGIYGYHRSL